MLRSRRVNHSLYTLSPKQMDMVTVGRCSMPPAPRTLTMRSTGRSSVWLTGLSVLASVSCRVKRTQDLPSRLKWCRSRASIEEVSAPVSSFIFTATPPGMISPFSIQPYTAGDPAAHAIPCRERQANSKVMVRNTSIFTPRQIRADKGPRGQEWGWKRLLSTDETRRQADERGARAARVRITASGHKGILLKR